jgi:hypothetical protein
VLMHDSTKPRNRVKSEKAIALNSSDVHKQYQMFRSTCSNDVIFIRWNIDSGRWKKSSQKISSNSLRT